MEVILTIVLLLWPFLCPMIAFGGGCWSDRGGFVEMCKPYFAWSLYLTRFHDQQISSLEKISVHDSLEVLNYVDCFCLLKIVQLLCYSLSINPLFNMISLPISGDVLRVTIFRMTARHLLVPRGFLWTQFSLNCCLKLKLLKPVMPPGSRSLASS